MNSSPTLPPLFCLWQPFIETKRAWHFFKDKLVDAKDGGELNKGKRSSFGGTLLLCHRLWPFPFVLTRQGSTLSKWPMSFVRDSSHPLFFYSLSICHLQWPHDATASVSSVTTLTLKMNKIGGKERSRREVLKKKELTSSFNWASECPGGHHYPNIRTNLTCLLLEM